MHVADVELSEIFVGSPSLEGLLREGSHAVSSYPLHASGGVRAVLSFHYDRPRRDDDTEEGDTLARTAAQAVAQSA